MPTLRELTAPNVLSTALIPPCTMINLTAGVHLSFLLFFLLLRLVVVTFTWSTVSFYNHILFVSLSPGRKSSAVVYPVSGAILFPGMSFTGPSTDNQDTLYLVIIKNETA